MSTSMLANPDVPTLFSCLTEEELAQPVQTLMTDEEFDAFILSVSPQHTTEFNLPDDSNSTFDTNATIDEIIAFTTQNFSSDMTTTSTNVQPDFMNSGTMTPKEFVVGCGLDPADFKSLQTPPTGDLDTWNVVLDEMLDKMTEWVKLNNISLTEMGVSIEDLEKFGLLDAAQLSA